MKNLVIAGVLALCSFGAAASTGGTPNIPCFKDGEMIASAISPVVCEAQGGTVYPDEAGVPRKESGDIHPVLLGVGAAALVTIGLLNPVTW